MYLYVWKNGESCQSENNITPLDVLGVVSGTLQIFYLKGAHYCKLIKDGLKLLWMPVGEINKLMTAEGGLNHP